jgi:hypothetical protein
VDALGAVRVEVGAVVAAEQEQKAARLVTEHVIDVGLHFRRLFSTTIVSQWLVCGNISNTVARSNA